MTFNLTETLKTTIKNLKDKFLTKKYLIILLLITALASGAGFWGYLGVNYYQARLAEQEARQQAARELLASLGEQSPADEHQKLSMDEIITLYKPRFKALENVALKSLEDLFNEAMEDYLTRKERGTLDRMRLANEYLQKGQRLEKTVDIAFETLLEEMKAELNSNNHAPDKTHRIKEEIKELYKEAKNEKKQELFRRVREELDS